MSKHTPKAIEYVSLSGPESDDEGCEWWRIGMGVDGDMVWIAAPFEWESERAEGFARLIAAAQDAVEAVKVAEDAMYAMDAILRAHDLLALVDEQEIQRAFDTTRAVLARIDS